MPRFTKQEQQEALDRLRQWVPKGSTVYTIARHVSASGMSRSISVVSFGIKFVCGSCGNIDSTYNHPTKCESCGIYRSPVADPSWLSWNVAKALGMPHDDRREAVKIGGAGMDMGFAIVSHLAYALYGDERALKHRWL